jgi:hypothetical protein
MDSNLRINYLKIRDILIKHGFNCEDYEQHPDCLTKSNNIYSVSFILDLENNLITFINRDIIHDRIRIIREFKFNNNFYCFLKNVFQV